MDAEYVLDTVPSIEDDCFMAKRQAHRLSDQLRQAIRRSEASCYVISKATRIDQGTLSKFLKGERGMSLESVDRIAAFLNLELRSKPKR
jgi:hypothetical protein